MNTKKLLLYLLLALGALTLSACGGAPVANNWSGLAADADHAYLTAGPYIYAVDLETGREVWRYPEKAEKMMFYANPVLTDDGQLLIGSTGTDHPFISLDPATGKEKWTQHFTNGKSGWVASPLVFNGAIYAPNTDGFLYIIDMDGKEAADPIKLGGALWSAPSTDGTYLYVASLDHHVHVIDPVEHIIVDTFDLGGAVPGSPTVGNGGIYVGSFASSVKFFDLNGVDEVIATAENWIWGSPTLDGETLYYADLDGVIYSLDIAGGGQNWRGVQPDGPVVADLLIVGDQVYVATEAGTFVALDRDGNIVWEKEVGGKIYTSPVASGDLILVAPYQAQFVLAAFDAEGKQAWTFVPEE